MQIITSKHPDPPPEDETERLDERPEDAHIL